MTSYHHASSRTRVPRAGKNVKSDRFLAHLILTKGAFEINYETVAAKYRYLPITAPDCHWADTQHTSTSTNTNGMNYPVSTTNATVDRHDTSRGVARWRET
eukprot:scaffold5298_cov26-Prasinocladus_malaysianus.AAC.1